MGYKVSATDANLPPSLELKVVLLQEDSWTELSGHRECGRSVLAVVDLGAYEPIVEAQHHVLNKTF